MISARDEFFLEREHIKELASLIERSDLTHDEIDGINLNMTEQEYEELKRELQERELSSLERVRRGETLNQWQINEAVKQAAKND